MYRIDFSVPIEIDEKKIIDYLAYKLDVKKSSLSKIVIEKKSLDSRNKRNIRWFYRILFECSEKDVEKKKEVTVVTDKAILPSIVFDELKGEKVVIVGSGPAGLFAALRLAQSGAKCILIERGKKIEERIKDVNNFLKKGILDEESNIQFGEGGAGTFSDGKLTARTKHPFYNYVINELIEAGAPEEIRYISNPHIGTDRLRTIIVNMRKKLLSLGAEIYFNERFERLILGKDRKAVGVVTSKREILCNHIILAIGYSARDTLENLHDQGVFLEAKGFAMGYRLELSQKKINTMQYGENNLFLPPAEFFLNTHFKEDNLSVYTFCMCPGGVVVPACSKKEFLVLNGMSYYKRNGNFGNAAIVISLHPKVWQNDVFGGVELQKSVESKAFIAGGRSYTAPAVTTIDFISEKVSSSLPESTYPLGIKPYPIWEFYERWKEFFKRALLDFNKKMKGIISDDAILIAPETRTSSPIRIRRDENGMSINTPFLYPCGEGAGYAGGIITSAVDGLKISEKIKHIG